MGIPFQLSGIGKYSCITNTTPLLVIVVVLLVVVLVRLNELNKLDDLIELHEQHTTLLEKHQAVLLAIYKKERKVKVDLGQVSGRFEVRYSNN